MQRVCRCTWQTQSSYWYSCYRYNHSCTVIWELSVSPQIIPCSFSLYLHIKTLFFAQHFCRQACALWTAVPVEEVPVRWSSSSSLPPELTLQMNTVSRDTCECSLACISWINVVIWVVSSSNGGGGQKAGVGGVGNFHFPAGFDKMCLFSFWLHVRTELL